jgi:hypothetical protein
LHFCRKEAVDARQKANTAATGVHGPSALNLQTESQNKPGGESVGEEEKEIMSIIAKASGDFTPAPAGTHATVCVDVIDLGVRDVTYQGKTQRKHQIVIVWKIDGNLDDGGPFFVRRRYTCSLHEKATLRGDLESWRGRPFTDQELKAFDLENLLSVPCLINVIHETRNGSVYANVASVMQLPKGMTAPVPGDYVRVIDRPHAQMDAADNGREITDDDA